MFYHLYTINIHLRKITVFQVFWYKYSDIFWHFHDTSGAWLEVHHIRQNTNEISPLSAIPHPTNYSATNKKNAANNHPTRIAFLFMCKIPMSWLVHLLVFACNMHISNHERVIWYMPTLNITKRIPLNAIFNFISKHLSNDLRAHLVCFNAFIRKKSGA